MKARQSEPDDVAALGAEGLGERVGDVAELAVTSRTLAAVAGATSGELLMTRLTVAIETPAASATSRIEEDLSASLGLESTAAVFIVISIDRTCTRVLVGSESVQETRRIRGLVVGTAHTGANETLSPGFRPMRSGPPGVATHGGMTRAGNCEAVRLRRRDSDALFRRSRTEALRH